MNVLLHLCRLLLRTFPEQLREGLLSELPDLVVRLVAEARIEKGRWAAMRMAVVELGGFVGAGLRAWARLLGDAVSGAGISALPRIVPDLRILLTLALRERGATVALVVIIAVASGSTATFASLGQAIRADATSVETADRLGWIWANRNWEPDGSPLLSDIHLDHLRERSESFEGLAGLWMVSGRLRGWGPPVHVDVVRASANVFDLLGVEPHLGRLFRSGDDRPGAPWVAVLTFDFWTTHFGADPDVIGARLVVGVPEMEVVGILPEGFDFPLPEALGPYGEPAVWLPTRHQSGGGVPQDVQAVLGLRRIDVSRPVVAEELAELGQEADSAVYGRRGFGYSLQSLPSGRNPGFVRAVGFVTVAVVGMMAVALANVFLLSGAREKRRTRVLDVLRLVGGTRRRLASVICLEAAVLGFIGATFGLLLAVWALGTLRSAPVFPDSLPPGSLVTWLTVWVVGACAAVLAMGHGAAAALRVVRAPRGTPSSGGTPHALGPIGGGRRTLRKERGLILVQVALALVLVVGSVLLERAVRGALAGGAGFRPGGLVTFTLYPMPDDYPDGRSRDRFLADVERHLIAHPAVEQVTGASALPFSGGSTQVPARRSRPAVSVDPNRFSVAEWMGFDGALLGAEAETGASRVVDLNVAQPGFFTAVGIPVLSGREFERSDSAVSRPVVVVGQGLVDALWQGRDPIRDSLWVVGGWRRVVGVVPRTLLHGLSSGERPQAWIPHSQVLAGRMSVVLVTTLPVAAAARLAHDAVGKVDRSVPVGRVMAVESMVYAETREERLVSGVVMVFSSIALMMAALAVYGLMSSVVTERRRDIAIRLAMGGSGGQLGLQLVRESIAVAMVGAALGGAVYALLDRAFDPLSFVGGPQPGIGLYAAVAALCFLIGCLAGINPGRRAAKTDPVVLLASP